MSLKELNLEPAYFSDKDDLLNDFYIPALSNSVIYNRIAGYFSSNSFAVAAKGISKFIDNNGKIRLIANVVLSEEDQTSIKESLEKIENDLILELKNLEETLKKDHIAALGWLIKTGKLEIKIAVVKQGIEHQKIGIMKDADGNTLSFSGSDNETYQGWLNNDEQFHVFCSWIDGDKNHLKMDVERFDTLWENKSKQNKVYSVSDAFKNGLIELAPKDSEEFKRLTKQNVESLLESNKTMRTELKHSQVKLWDYQEEALNNWLKKNKRGIFEMATGTGKTFTALACLRKVLNDEKKLVCVISTPYSHLNKQWEENIKRFGLDYETLIAESSNPSWKKQLSKSILDINNNVSDVLLVITTHVTLSSPSFIESIKLSKCKLFLIADEVHGVGAKQRREGLINNYDFRLGLSATPKRYFDEDGTEIILKYFDESINGKSTFEFSLHDAINKINPDTGKPYLAPYEYRPYFVELTNAELTEYIERTKKIAKAYYASKGEEESNEYYQLLCIQRQKIIVKAINKFDAFRQIINDIGQISHCLIYCSDKQQLSEAMKILDSKNIRKHRFIGEEGTTPKKEYGGISERQYILDKFSEGMYQALVAIKVLDEGIDIPAAKTAIILASSGNPKEYIQRRGRVLRCSPNKEKATIYDVSILPKLNSKIPKEILEIEKNILKKELKRIKEFSISAVNAIDCLEQIQNIEKRYLVS